MRVLRLRERLSIYVTDGAILGRLGLRPDGKRRSFQTGDLECMLGPYASVRRVRAGLGVSGFVATIDATGLTGLDQRA